MLRATDPASSREFYEALGTEFRDLPIVRDGELEPTDYFFGFPRQEDESTFNHDGRPTSESPTWSRTRKPMFSFWYRADGRSGHVERTRSLSSASPRQTVGVATVTNR
jgi:hypothetical protein